LANSGLYTPCIKPIVIDSNRMELVIPIAPLRSVTLLLPETYREGEVMATISDNSILGIREPNNTNSVYIYNKSWENIYYGIARDLTLSTKDGLYITAVFIMTDKNYCGTLEFTYSDEYQQKINAQKMESNKQSIASLRKEALDNIEGEINNRLLEKIGQILVSRSDNEYIKESVQLKTNNGLQGKIIFDSIKRQGAFNVAKFIIHNNMSEDFLLNSISLENESGGIITGVLEGDLMVDKRKKSTITFSSLQRIPDTGGKASFLIGSEEVEIKW